MTNTENPVKLDAARRQNRLAEMLDGLGGEDDWYWRDVATRRMQALEDDGAMFGLVAHEAQELAALKRALRTSKESPA